MVIVATMAVGYEVNGERQQVTVRGFGSSRKSAKTNGYRKAMSEIKRLTSPERYKVVYSFPAQFAEVEDRDAKG